MPVPRPTGPWAVAVTVRAASGLLLSKSSAEFEAVLGNSTLQSHSMDLSQ